MAEPTTAALAAPTPLLDHLSSRGKSQAAQMLKQRGYLLSKNDNMAFDAYISFGKDLEGESTDDGHKKWIAVRGIDFGASLPIKRSRSDGGADTVDRPHFETFFFTKDLDKATPNLLKACATGQKFDTVTLDLCVMLANAKKPYLTVTYEKVYVTSLSSVAAADDDSIPTELVGLSFGKIKITYQPVDLVKAALGGKVEAEFDLSALTYK
ncbi:MAG: type VI secretion system tube protein Hcp [Planctomycetota bacterium]|jgi:type VI secretion system secreted protein Hcp|nr:type VI secretion system tube protein Hcp [Planctomycetota bacterium]